MDNKKKYGFLTLGAIALITVFRLWYITLLPLSADEAYLWVCGRNLALSFYDTPPMAPYMIFFSTLLFGSTEFGVRAFVAVFMAVAAWIVYALALHVSDGGHKAAFTSSLLVLIIPGFAAAALLSGVEAPLILFYVLTVYLLYHAMVKGKNYCWYLAGITFGLGFLSKYLMLFLPLCLLLLMLFTEHRKFFKTRYPYIFILTGTLVSSPVIIWNAQNEWASFILNFFSRTRTSPVFSLNLMNFIKHSGAQAGIMSPFIFILTICALAAMAYRGWAKKDKSQTFLFFFSAPILLFFAMYSLFIEIPAPHWVGIGYLTPIAVIPVIIYGKNGKRWKRMFFRLSVFTALIISAVLHAIPFSGNVLLRLPVKDSTRKNFESFVANWQGQLGTRLGEVRDSVEKNGNYFLIGRGFALASYLEFYNPGQERVYMICQRTKVGHGYYFWQDINENIGMNAIFVDEDSRCEAYLKEIFRKVERLPDYKIYNERGELLRSFTFYNCKHFRGMEKEVPHVLR